MLNIIVENTLIFFKTILQDFFVVNHKILTLCIMLQLRLISLNLISSVNSYLMSL